MHKNHKTLGDVIKYAREQSNYTVEQLAEKIGITERYLYKIENEDKKPRYDVLHKLVKALSISPHAIFYPDKPYEHENIKDILYILSNCDENSLNIFRSIAQTLCNTKTTK